jgi:hypothetical protein
MSLVVLSVLYALGALLFVAVFLLVRLPLRWPPERIVALIVLAVALYLGIVGLLVIGAKRGWIPG